MRNWLLTIGLLVALGAASYGIFLATAPVPVPEGFLYANGHVEGTEVSVSAEVTAAVLDSNLREGKRVSSGDLLLRLDDRNFQDQLDIAEAEQVARLGIVAQHRAELSVWRHHLDSAQRDLDRATRLAAESNLSKQQLRTNEDKVTEAKGKVLGLDAAITHGEAQVRSATARLALIRRELEKTRIVAPISATILTKAIEKGELATRGQVVAVLVDLERLELRVYVPERDLGKVPIGGEARLVVDAFPERYFSAAVSKVDQRARFTPRDIHMPEERTRLVFGVTLVVDNPKGILKPGMPADAWIKWRSEVDWPKILPVPR